MQDKKIRLGISSCLIGQQVRFDGGHKTSNFCRDDLAPWVTWVPFCPEMAAGMPSPRPSIRLIKDQNSIIARSADGRDVTADLIQASQSYVDKIDDLSGYVVCTQSPSCGMERVKVYRGKDIPPDKNGIGLFTKELMDQHPNLPIEESGRLHDPLLRENFITRIFAYDRWRRMLKSGLSAKQLINFHSDHKYLLMAHDPDSYKKLGQLLSNLKQSLEPLAEDYITGFMAALSKPAKRQRHANVLSHLQGYFSDHLTVNQRAQFTQAVTDYREGLKPLMAPMILVHHYQAEYQNQYLDRQVYLSPYPEGLRLRYGL